MSRSAVRGLWLSQHAEWDRIEELRRAPPAPGLAPVRLPSSFTRAPGDYTISEEFQRWWDSSESDRLSGAWAKGLDGVATGGPELQLTEVAKTAAETFGQVEGVNLPAPSPHAAPSSDVYAAPAWSSDLASTSWGPAPRGVTRGAPPVVEELQVEDVGAAPAWLGLALAVAGAVILYLVAVKR